MNDTDKKIFYLVVFFSILKLIIHLYTNAFASYGIFRDEFYYIACSNHLAAGYVDQPPFSIFMLALSRFLFGEGLFAIRLLPAVMAALTVFITGQIVIKMGGGIFAVVTACLAVITAPIILGMNTIYSMNTFDHLFWALSAYLVLFIIKEDSRKYWILLGIVLGLGMLNKIGISWFIAGFYTALLLSDKRQKFLTPDPYITGIIALLIFSPFIIWNLMNEFAHIEFIRNATTFKYGGLTRADFIFGQFMLINPVNVLVWIPGLIFLFFNKEGKEYRMLGIIFITAFLILLINGKSKAEYLSPAYPMLFAAGGIIIEKIRSRNYFKWIKYALPVLMIIMGVLSAPFALPILPVKTFIKYQAAMGMSPSTSEGYQLNELPQFYADMFGWENMAKTVSKVYQSLPEEEKNNLIVFAQNYGQAGALQYYSKKYPLPPVVSIHNNYWIWRYPDFEVKNVIVLGGDKEDHLESCTEVNKYAVVKSRYAIPYENNLPVYFCRGLKVDPAVVWKNEKRFM